MEAVRRRRPGSATGEADSKPRTMKAECEGEGGKRVTANENPKKLSQKERTQAHGRRSGEKEDNCETARARKKRSQREERTPHTKGKRLRVPEKTAMQERVEQRKSQAK